MTQELLSDRSGVSVREISLLENLTERRAVHPAVTAALAGGLGLAEPQREQFMAAARSQHPDADPVPVRSGPALPGPVSGGQPDLPGTSWVVPRQLPAGPGALTGRAAELESLAALIGGVGEADGRPGPVVISAVSGTAGVGKTALAVHWAHQIAGQFPDGQLYVNLRGYDPGQPAQAGEVLEGFLRAVGVNAGDIPAGTDARATMFRSRVAGRRLLMLLDNAGSTDQVRPLLPGSSSVLVIVTSRDDLAGLVIGYHACRLELDLLPAEDATALLRTMIGSRAGSDPAATAELARLCARLPLALCIAGELARSRKDLPLAALAAELGLERARLDLLNAGGDQYLGVRSVFSWSCRHLPPGAAAGFALLGLHPAPDWDRYAAAALTGTTPAEADSLLDALARAHLIQAAGPGRYTMHDLLRTYAAELAARGSPGPHHALTRLFDYYLAAADAAASTVLCWLASGSNPFLGAAYSSHGPRGTVIGSGPGPAYRDRRPSLPPPGLHLPPMTDPSIADPRIADAWLRTELPTLAVVTAHAASHGWPAHATRLATALDPRLFADLTDEALRIYTRAAEAAGECGDYPAQAHFLISLGKRDRRRGDNRDDPDCYQEAARRFRQALDIARSCGDPGARARALVNLAAAYAGLDDYQQATACCQEALTVTRDSGDTYGQIRALNNLGCLHSWQHQYEKAAPLYDQARNLSREIGYDEGEHAAKHNLQENCSLVEYCTRKLENPHHNSYSRAELLIHLGLAYQQEGSNHEAAERFRQAREAAAADEDEDTLTRALNDLGDVYAQQGRYQDAATCYHEVLKLLDTPDGYDRCRIRALNNLGCICAWAGNPEQASRHYQEALADPDSPHQSIAQANLDQIANPAGGCHNLMQDFLSDWPDQHALEDGYHLPSIMFWATGPPPRIAFTQAGPVFIDK